MTATAFKHAKLGALMLVAMMLLVPQFAMAGDKGISFEADGGIGYMAPPKTVYEYTEVATGERNDLETQSGSSYTLGVKAAYALTGLGWGEDSFFGSAPEIELAYRYDYFDDKREGMSRTASTNPAAGYGNTGNWVAGTWNNKQKIANNSLRLGLWGSDPADGGFVPYVGIGYQKYEQKYNLDSDFGAAMRHVFQSDLDAHYVGLTLGGEYRTAKFSGWQFVATPMVFTHYVRSFMNFQQNPDGGIGGFATVDDKMDTTFLSSGASMDLSVKKHFGSNFYLGLTGGAVYNTRTPYSRPPTTEFGRAQIASDGSYAFRGTLDLGLEF